MHSIWRAARGPFHALVCAQHTWERYDTTRAGCLRCGCEHVCAPTAVGSQCPLAHLDDGGLCCTVTGFCPPVVRYSDSEYVEHFVPREPARPPDENLHGEVLEIVEWFLMGNVTRACKREETARALGRFACTVIKTLKQHKLCHGPPVRLPCLPTVIAQALHALRPQRIMPPSRELCDFCAQHIVKCLRALKIAPPPHKRMNLVVGLLYLMKQGLVIQNTQWLPRTRSLVCCLPHENCLEKTFKLSMKLVCETENEVKLALRLKTRRL